MKLGAILTVLVVLTSFVSANALISASNHVELSGTRNGQLAFWFSSVEPASFAVNVNSELVTQVDPAVGAIGAGAVKSFTVTFKPPVCSEGTFYATVNVDLVANGVTQRLSKPVELTVTRTTDCSPVIVGYPRTNYVGSAANQVTGSSLSLSNRFDAQEANVVISSRDGISNVANGERTAMELSIVNRGAPGAFEVSLVADPALNAVLNYDYFVLERSEVKKVTLSVNASSVLQGRQWVEVQVTRNGQVASVKRIYVDVANSHSLILEMPQVVNTDNCGVVPLAGTISNPGSAVEIARVAIPTLYAASNDVVLQPRSTKPFVLNVDVSSLSQGVHLFEFNLESDAGASSKQVVRFNIAQCKAAAVNLVNYSLVVSNTGNETMAGVVASVENIPANWKVYAPNPVDIAPGQNVTLAISIEPIGEASQDVVPVLVARAANGVEVARKTVEPIRANSLSGLFLAGMFGFSGLQWIAGLVFVALIIAVASARLTIRRTTA